MKRKRRLAFALALVAGAAAIVLSWSFVEPTSAKTGYSCNPGAGHGDPGCHVAVTTPPTAPPTTRATAPPTTRTTVRPTTRTTVRSTTPTTSSDGTPIAGTTGTSADPTTTAAAPTATEAQSTTTTVETDAAVAGTSGGSGGGISGGWIALMVGLGLFGIAGWTGMAVKSAKSRRTSAGHSAPAAQANGPVRFVLAERLAHWIYALCFIAAGLTGALMWIPATAQWLAEARYTVSQYHGYVGLAMVIVPLLILLVLDRRRLAEDRRVLDEWTVNDRRWLLAALTGGMFRGKKMPPQGRFNAGQKLNSHFIAGLAIGFVATGTVLLLRVHLPFWLTSGVLFAHEVLAVTGGALLLGHLSIALFTRHGRGGLRAMVKGTLPTEVAREGHALWYAEWLKQNRREDAGTAAADL
jgi:formate dehydrogenase subunit gamma